MLWDGDIFNVTVLISTKMMIMENFPLSYFIMKIGSKKNRSENKMKIFNQIINNQVNKYATFR